VPLSDDDTGIDLSQLRWRCRRGMRELDVLLIRYLDRRWAQASRSERKAFVQLVEMPDPELFGYLVGTSSPADATQREVISVIRRFEP
jgi:antitoxin CptB